MYEGYQKLFFASKEISEEKLYENLINKLEDFNDKFILYWEQDDLEGFMKSLGSKSVNSVNKYLNYLRTFYKFICKTREITPNKLDLQKDLKYYIDQKKLMRVTLTEHQYKTLRDLLPIEIGHNTYNYRDACILVLAWEGLSNYEIKYLMEDDIEFFSEYGIQKCKLHLKTRSVLIDDFEAINIIKKTMREQKYFIQEAVKHKDGIFNLKDTPALIRAAIVSRKSNKITVANPGEVLKRVFRRVEKIDGTNINLKEMTIEDVKRGRIIDLLRKKEVTVNDIRNMFGKESSCDVHWLSEIAVLMERESRQKGS
jgi:site-specific recombinase XerD